MTRRATVTTGLLVFALLLGAPWVALQPAHPSSRFAAHHPVLAGSPTTSTVPPPAPAATTPVTPPAAVRPNKPAKLAASDSRSLRLKRTTGLKAVALTFDDGPNPVWTPMLLDRLRAARVKATFCLVGVRVQRYPALVARIVREGHTLCNHTWNHQMDLGTRSETEIRADLARTNEAIRRAVPGARIPYFRHPGGKWTHRAIAVARQLGMISLHWSVDPRDWEMRDAAVISKRVLGAARAGAIVLLHDGGGDRAATVRAVSGIVESLKRRYGIVRLR